MTGLPSYSTTASENISSNTGINWDEGMPPATVNNSARQNMADDRSQWNDASWFQYGAGSKTVAAVYSSATAVTFTGADATAYWHAGRRVKAVGSGTGTIYGKVASSSYGAGATTVNFTWDSGSLSNETLTVYASTTPVTGKPSTLLACGDYVESTFTPSLQFNSATTGITYSGRGGFYTKIGNRIFFNLQMSLTSSGSATGPASIAGLPFTSSNTTANRSPCALETENMPNLTVPQAYIGVNAAVIALINFAAPNSSAMNDTNFNGTSVLIVSGHYFV